MSICKQLLLNMCSWNWEKLKFIHKRFLKKSKRPSFFEINIRKKFMVLISWFVSHEDLFGVVRNKLQLLKIYCKSKEDQKFKKRIHHVRSHTYALNFDQWKMLSEKYKPVRVWFWQIYREKLSLVTFVGVHSNSKEVSYLFWQNTYPNLKTTGHIKLKFFLWTKLQENLLLVKYLISAAARLNPLCSPSIETESKTHYFLRCNF